MKTLVTNSMQAMQKIDFKIGLLRKNLVHMGLSPLASWPVLLLMVIFYFDPTRYLWSIQGLLAKIFLEGNAVGLWLFETSLLHLLFVGFVFFLLEWFFRVEFILVGLVLLLQSHADVHVLFSVAAVFGIYLAQTSYLWWFYIELKSQVRKLWNSFSLVLYISWLFSFIASIGFYIFLKQWGYFSFSIYANRYEFLVISLLCIYVVRLFFTMIWGHFIYLKLNQDGSNPDKIKISYSTTTWILRYKMSLATKKLLKEQVDTLLQSYDQQRHELQEIKDQSLGVIPAHLQKNFYEQYEYLKLASQRLSVQD